MLLQRLEESNVQLYDPALESLKTLIKSSTTSMTSVPKPLKFLRPQYGRIKAIYEKLQDTNTKVLQDLCIIIFVQASCAEVVSVVGMVMYDNAEFKTDTLKYRLLSKNDDIGIWGHEYVRLLTKQIVEVWDEIDTGETKESMLAADKQKQEYLELVEKILPYLMDHNAESEAIDLCMEIEHLEFLEKFTNELNYQRVCLYLIGCASYIPDPENIKVYRCAQSIYRKYKDYGNAVRYALRINDHDLARKMFAEAGNLPVSKYGATSSDVRRQLAFLLAKQQFIIPYEEVWAEDDQKLADIMANNRMSEYFLSLARELDIMEPKARYI